jgi:hypothetical protein
MHNPSGSKRGLVLVKNIANNVSQDFGCELIIDTELDKKSKAWRVGGRNDYANKILNKHDPQLDENLPVEAGMLVDAISNYSKNIIVPVEIEANINSVINVQKTSDISADYMYINASPHSLLLQIDFLENEYYYRNGASYRGQAFKFRHKVFNYINLKFDILSGNAEEWLKFNRSEMKEEAFDKLEELLYLALYERIRIGMQDVDKFKEIQGNEIIFSLFLKAMGEAKADQHPKWLEWVGKFKDNWLESKVSEGENVRNILDKASWVMKYNPHADNVKVLKSQSTEENGSPSELEYGSRGEILFSFMVQRYFEDPCAVINISYKDDAELYGFSKEGNNKSNYSAHSF